MTTPEDAARIARELAEELRAEGTYPAADDPAPPPPQLASNAHLAEWAVIDPPHDLARSTRRWGAPVTALKQGLLRLLFQYHTEQNAQQTRFNANLLARVRRLEDRVAELEAERDRWSDPS